MHGILSDYFEMRSENSSSCLGERWRRGKLDKKGQVCFGIMLVLRRKETKGYPPIHDIQYLLVSDHLPIDIKSCFTRKKHG